MTVVMTVFNAEQHLAEALESVFAQTLQDFELVVVDDASTDETPRILESFVDPRLVIVRQPANTGQAAASTAACRIARGRYIARLDADDVAHPERLARQVEYLDQHRDIALVGAAAIFTDEWGREFARFSYPEAHEEIQTRLDTGSAFVHSTVMMRREALEAVGGYRLSPRGADYELWLRMIERYRAANLSDPLVRYRIHPGQVTANALREGALCSLVALEAAKRRRAGEPDRLAGGGLVDDSLAASLGIDASAVDRAHVREIVWYAKLLSGAGYSAEARDLVESGGRIAKASGDREQQELVRAARVSIAPTPLDRLRSAARRAFARLA